MMEENTTDPATEEATKPEAEEDSQDQKESDSVEENDSTEELPLFRLDSEKKPNSKGGEKTVIVLNVLSSADGEYSHAMGDLDFGNSRKLAEGVLALLLDTAKTQYLEGLEETPEAEEEAGVAECVSDLLAVIHGDGGQHLGSVGLEQACVDAIGKLHSAEEEAPETEEETEEETVAPQSPTLVYLRRVIESVGLVPEELERFHPDQIVDSIINKIDQLREDAGELAAAGDDEEGDGETPVSIPAGSIPASFGVRLIGVVDDRIPELIRHHQLVVQWSTNGMKEKKPEAFARLNAKFEGVATAIETELAELRALLGIADEEEGDEEPS